MSMSQPDCRAAAAKCLTSISSGQSLNQQLPRYEQQVKDCDRALLKQLCYGVLRFYPRLLAISQLLLKKPIKNKDRDVLMLILLGGYQLMETRIPEHAAVSATVAATQALKKPWAKALVNGVLRQWQRNVTDLCEELSPAQQLAHPQWLHQAIVTAWPQQAKAIEQQNNQHPPMCLRINQREISRAAYMQQLSDASIEAMACNYADDGVRLQRPIAVDRLPGFKQGCVSVQDEAAQLAPTLMALEAGQRVLDACCAPGGKTCHILESEPRIGEVVALDVDKQRLTKVTDNLKRLSLRASVVTGDASQPDSWWDGQPFDRILLDAPCSATGVIRRNPDIKLHRNQQDIAQLSQQQLQLLSALWTILKPGGLLLYATCSILPDENEKVIERFCQSQADARHLHIDAPWGIERPFGRQLFPMYNGHDGFYYAKLTKKFLQ